MSGVKDSIAGGVGGLLQALVGHPFDTVKVRLQTDHTGKYTSMLQTFRLIAKEEGTFAVYKGIQSPLSGMIVMNAVAFSSFAEAKRRVAGPGVKTSGMTTQQLFLAGGLAGVAMAFVEGPIDFLKCQLQVNFAKYNGLVDAARKIITQGGLIGAYQGFGATLLRNIPSNALYFGCYEEAKRIMAGSTSTESLTSFQLLMSGGIGGMGYWAFTYPTDVIKSKMQSDATEKSKRVYPTISSTVSSILKKEGIAGFYRGFTPCIIRSFPANAVCFLAYEQTIKML